MIGFRSRRIAKRRAQKLNSAREFCYSANQLANFGQGPGGRTGGRVSQRLLALFQRNRDFRGEARVVLDQRDVGFEASAIRQPEDAV